jgi:ERCC4-type nuclease
MNPMSPRVIRIDYRERRAGLAQAVQEHGPEFVVSEEQLRQGDVVIGDVAIERKTANGLLLSLIEGRLFPQLLRMKICFPRTLLLVEGDLSKSPIQVTEAARRGAFTAIAARLQLPILYAKDVNESAAIVISIARQEFCAVDKVACGGPTVRRSAGINKKVMRVLTGVPMIGPKRAKLLISRFSTLKNVFSANLEELAQVEGIGPVVARELLAVATAKLEKP